MSTNALSKTDAENIAKALTGFGIKKISGNGVTLELRDALKKKAESVSISSVDDTKTISDFFDKINKVENALESIKNDAGSWPLYGKLALINDAYDYINTMSQIEEGKLTNKGFDARKATCGEITAQLDELHMLHTSGSGIMTKIRDFDSNAKVFIFKNDDLRQYYDYYIKFRQNGIYDNVKTLRKLPDHLLTSVQVAERVLTSLQSAMHITRSESIWLYNHMLELKGMAEYTDMEGENTVLSCPDCGAVFRMTSQQLAALYGKKQTVPKCQACQEPLLKKCPKCGKWIPMAAREHFCGWNENFTRSKTSLDNAIKENNITAIQSSLEALGQMTITTDDLQESKKKAKAILTDYITTIKGIQETLASGDLKDAKQKIEEAEKRYPENDIFLSLRNELMKREINAHRAALLFGIGDALDRGKLEEVRNKIKQAEEAGIDAGDLTEYKRELMQRSKIIKANNYSRTLETLIQNKKTEEAEKTLIEAELFGIGDELYKFRQKLNKLKEENEKSKKEALELFGDGHFGAYVNGLRKISQILDIYPDCLQAKIWLKDNPPTSGVKEPLLTFVQGEKQCTISWKDDDSYTRYTVCRAEGRYPRDPEDGVQVCKEITNNRVTDKLPEDQPGIIWQYSIFSVRILDGRFVKTDCPREAAWLPPPKGVRTQSGKDEYGEPVITVSWNEIPRNCTGVQILRKDNDGDDFNFTTPLMKVDSKNPAHQEAQKLYRYVDKEIEPGITYRYVLKQVWKKGASQFTSNDVTVDATVDQD